MLEENIILLGGVSSVFLFLIVLTLVFIFNRKSKNTSSKISEDILKIKSQIDSPPSKNSVKKLR